MNSRSRELFCAAQPGFFRLAEVDGCNQTRSHFQTIVPALLTTSGALNDLTGAAIRNLGANFDFLEAKSGFLAPLSETPIGPGKSNSKDTV